jgi:hypothetical protein
MKGVNMENKIIVESWKQLQDELFNNSWNKDIERYRSNYAFRGLSDKDYQLKTSLNRVCGDYERLEKNLLRNFKKYSRSAFDNTNDFWNYLSIAQHHGLPTRLLDWTYSPYVALHFATEDLKKYDKDAVIWCVDFIEAHKQLPVSLKELLEKASANSFTTEMLNEKINNFRELQTISEDDVLIFFEPPSIDDRIINQYAIFSVLSNPKIYLDKWLTKNKDLYKKIIIPSELKWEVRDKLDQANITERVLFPGLDGLCDWLSRHYTPR